MAMSALIVTLKIQSNGLFEEFCPPEISRLLRSQDEFSSAISDINNLLRDEAKEPSCCTAVRTVSVVFAIVAGVVVMKATGAAVALSLRMLPFIFFRIQKCPTPACSHSAG